MTSGSLAGATGGAGGAAACTVGVDPKASRRRSRRSIRSNTASGRASASGLAARMRATSSVMRGSGASRIATIAPPTSSITRTQRAVPRAVDDLGGVALRAGRPADGGGADENEEVAAQSFDDLHRELGGVAPLADGPVERDEGTGDVAFGERRDERRKSAGIVIGGASGGDLVEHGERVTGRASGAPDDRGRTFSGEVDPGDVSDPGDERRELVLVDEVELVVLGPAAQRRQDFLRVGRREHEHDAVGWLLERLQQRVRRRRSRACGPRRRCRPSSGPVSRATPGRRGPASRRRRCSTAASSSWTSNEVPAVIDSARLAGPARFAAVGRRAVERLGEDPGGRGLAGPARPAEEVGVGDVAVAHGVDERPRDVVLAAHLREALGSEAPVEGLEGPLLARIAPSGSVGSAARR